MKEKIFYAFALIFLIACNSKRENDNPEPNVEMASNASTETTADCDCFTTDVSIAPEGVLFWEAAWYKYYGIDSKQDTANQRFFSGDFINQITNGLSDPNAQGGYRVYYGLESPQDTIPILVMVAVDTNCNDMYTTDLNSNVIVTMKDTQFVCSMDYAEYYTSKWNTYNDENPWIETIIHAYNYDLASVQNLLTPDANGESGLTFEFGLRTLAPQETCFNQNSTDYGSIMYCNLVYGLNSNTSNGQDRMDFAMPCPKMCDSNDSPLSW